MANGGKYTLASVSEHLPLTGDCIGENLELDKSGNKFISEGWKVFVPALSLYIYKGKLYKQSESPIDSILLRHASLFGDGRFLGCYKCDSLDKVVSAYLDGEMSNEIIGEMECFILENNKKK